MRQAVPGVRVYTKPVNAVTPTEYTQCARLGYRKGAIRDAFKAAYRRAAPNTSVILAKQGDAVLSWALVQPHYRHGYSAMFWTRTRWRRRGLGARVARAVKRLTKGNCAVFRWEQVQFFRKTGFDTDVMT